MDTGSSWLWVAGEDCISCKRDKYMWHGSTTFKSLQTEDDITYGIGYAKGIVSND